MKKNFSHRSGIFYGISAKKAFFSANKRSEGEGKGKEYSIQLSSSDRIFFHVRTVPLQKG